MQALCWVRLGFCRARMGHVNDQHSVRPNRDCGHSLREGEDEDMADDKVEDVDKRKSAEGVIIEQERKSAEGAIMEKEEEEKEEEARIMRGKKVVRQPTQDTTSTCGRTCHSENGVHTV